MKQPALHICIWYIPTIYLVMYYLIEMKIMYKNLQLTNAVHYRDSTTCNKKHGSHHTHNNTHFVPFPFCNPFFLSTSVSGFRLACSLDPMMTAPVNLLAAAVADLTD